MKKIFILFLINFVFSASVSQEAAVNIAENFYNYKNDPRENNFSIQEITLFSLEDSVTNANAANLNA